MKDFSLSSLSSPLLTDPAVACSSSYGAPSTESPTTSPPSPTSDLHTNPDLIQSETDVATSSACDVRNPTSFALHKKCMAFCKEHCSNQKWRIVSQLTTCNLFSGNDYTFSSSEHRHYRPLLANTRRQTGSTLGGYSVHGHGPLWSDRPEPPHAWLQPM